TAVAKIIKRFEETGTHEDRTRSGRPRLTSESENKLIRVKSLQNRRLTVPEIQAQLKATRRTDVSTSTAQRRLREAGLTGRIAAKKPLLRVQNKRFEEWKSVLWTDESKFEIFGSNHQVFVRRREGERMSSACVVPTVKHGGGSVMVWGWFAGDRVGDLYQVHGKLIQHGYHSILQRHAIPSGLWLVGQSFILQQDNDQKHTSKLCKNYLAKESEGQVNLMTWPAQSPDLNPIELVREELDRRVKAKLPTSALHLWELLQKSWEDMSGDFLLKLVNRMPRVCEAVIKAKGG
ncbi:TCB1 transposase, partial [Polyodon spathula]|nr:TCB1 transposase [Polyodon spathula]